MRTIKLISKSIENGNPQTMYWFGVLIDSVSAGIRPRETTLVNPMGVCF
jgi:hypothetical protein